MNHSFVASKVNKAECGKCRRAMIDHTPLAVCESCGAKGICDVIDNMLLCANNCFKKHHDAMQSQLASAEETKKSIMEIAKHTDLAMSRSGDIFNAEIIASAAVRDEIYADGSLSDAEKHYKFNAFMQERILLYRAEMIEADKTKFDRGQKINGALEYLRQFASELAKTIKEEIKKQDQTYQPVINRVKPAGVRGKAAKSPQQRIQDNLIDALAEAGKESIESVISQLKAIGKLPATYTIAVYDGKYKDKIVKA